MDVSRRILVLNTPICIHFTNKYFETHGVLDYILSISINLERSIFCTVDVFVVFVCGAGGGGGRQIVVFVLPNVTT